MNRNITIGDKYSPAMTITDQAEADRYFEECVLHSMMFGNSREKAEDIERQNLGYFVGYCSAETRERVERLFRCKHPIFGSIAENGQSRAALAFSLGRERLKR